MVATKINDLKIKLFDDDTFKNNKKDKYMHMFIYVHIYISIYLDMDIEIYADMSIDMYV
jgi:hypothetical protein